MTRRASVNRRWARVVVAAALVCAASASGSTQAPAPAALPRLQTPTTVPVEHFRVPEGLEVTLWAASPLLFNPTNIDVDRDGRIWVAEGVRYAVITRADLPLLVELARGFDGADRAYLEALGTGATGKEAALYAALAPLLGHRDPPRWSDAFAWIAWRLHVPAAIDALAVRAGSETLALPARRRALDALAFIDERAASAAVVEVAAGDGPLREHALWWLLNRMTDRWAAHGLAETLRVRGLFDPATVRLETTLAPPRDAAGEEVDVSRVLALSGDEQRTHHQTRTAGAVADAATRRSGPRCAGCGRPHRPAAGF